MRAGKFVVELKRMWKVLVVYLLKVVAYRGGTWEGSTPPPEIPKALQNRAKINPIVKTVKNCSIY